jgi:hypothetical protein
MYHPQLMELADLARAFPRATITLNHVRGPLGIGPYADKKQETFAVWKAVIAELGKCKNVVVKLGGLGMTFGIFDFHTRETPPSSEELAHAYKPYIETCIAAFGPDRGMFESNFPPDGVSSSYAVLWNAFKLLAAGYSPDEKAKLFSGTAKRRLPPRLDRGAAGPTRSPMDSAVFFGVLDKRSSPSCPDYRAALAAADRSGLRLGVPRAMFKRDCVASEAMLTAFRSPPRWFTVLQIVAAREYSARRVIAQGHAGPCSDSHGNGPFWCASTTRAAHPVLARPHNVGVWVTGRGGSGVLL